MNKVVRWVQRGKWIGILLIALYWLSPDLIGYIESELRLYPKQEWSIRFWEIYHWPHFKALARLGPVFEPDAFFPSGWTIYLAWVVPMVVMALAWWVVLTLIERSIARSGK